MLTLRRGVVLAAGSPARFQDVEVRLGGDRRRALADVALVGPSAPGDEVVVAIGKPSLVHANLTRGLRGGGKTAAPAAPLKLPGTSLQHPVQPVEASAPAADAAPAAPPLTTTPPTTPRTTGAPVATAFVHAQLAPLAWAFQQAAPGARLGYVQTCGGALTGATSELVGLLRERGLLQAHITAGPAYGGEAEAVTTAGALQHGFADRHWHAAICAPGPNLVGSGTALGHGGMAALDSAHTAAALGCTVIMAPRRSQADPRPRHRGLSHHTRTVLDLALVPLVVATAGERPEPGLARHEWRRGEADLDGYAASGLPARALGRTLEEDPVFFAAALAAGSVLAAATRAAI